MKAKCNFDSDIIKIGVDGIGFIFQRTRNVRTIRDWKKTIKITARPRNSLSEITYCKCLFINCVALIISYCLRMERCAFMSFQIIHSFDSTSYVNSPLDKVIVETKWFKNVSRLSKIPSEDEALLSDEHKDGYSRDGQNYLRKN